MRAVLSRGMSRRGAYFPAIRPIESDPRMAATAKAGHNDIPDGGREIGMQEKNSG